jgi:hypothetical protein
MRWLPWSRAADRSNGTEMDRDPDNRPQTVPRQCALGIQIGEVCSVAA